VKVGDRVGTLARWRSPAPPWVEWLIVRPPDELPHFKPHLPDFVVKVFDGSRCGSSNDLFREFAREFSFPSYFGENWDALDDFLTDDYFVPTDGCLILFEKAKLLLSSSEREFLIFQSAMRNCGEAWATPDLRSQVLDDDGSPVDPQRIIPFHVVLVSSEHTDPPSRNWIHPVFEWNPEEIRPESSGAV